MAPAGRETDLRDHAQLLTLSPYSLGIEQGSLDLARLYSKPQDRGRFDERWPKFLRSDASLSKVIWQDGPDRLSFLTELLVPPAVDERLPVLLVVGNPAPHSVLNGLPFSYEGNYREHRFWTALRDTGFLNFDWGSRHLETWKEGNEARKEALYSLQYESPFCLGIAVYFSIPSPASVKDWAGVAGLRKLFRVRALRMIAAAEEERLRQTFKGFLHDRGAVVAFQSDAYEGLRLPSGTPYSRHAALNNLLEARCKLDPDVSLFCGPPTRWMQGQAAREVLKRVKYRLMAGAKLGNDSAVRPRPSPA